MVPVKKLDRYLLKSFLLALVVVTVAVGLTINVINIIEELRDFIDNDVPVASIAEYYLYFGGWVVKSFLPMFVLIASLFSVSMFARRNEILAMTASGISLYRIALPYLAVAAALSAQRILTMAEEYQQYTARLRLATQYTGDFLEVQAALRDVARDARAPIAETVNLYSRLGPSLNAMGRNGQQAA
ncbi:MAG TPA: LptF/LptG family permease, partial [candidate division Zixibacteria bacterium]|nr:LptF/LptG family permease [candidate division Zixibacteria bacterium]